MKRIFISQPMNGLTREEIIRTRLEVGRQAEYLFGKGQFVVINSLFNEVMQDDSNPLWDLGRSLQQMSTADVVMFAPGWEEYRGCVIENMCAKQYDIDTIKVTF